jgi:hypothetical protein
MGMSLWPPMDRHDGQPHYLHSVAAFPGVTLAPYMLPDLKSKRLTREHTSYLESQFQACAKPNTNVKRSIAVHLGVSVEKINNWFQNRRAKHKQDLKKLAQQQQADLNAPSKPNSNSGDSPQEPVPFAFTSGSSASSLPSAASSPPSLEFPGVKQDMSMSPASPTMQLDTAIPDMADLKVPLTPAMTPAVDTTTPMTTMSMPAISLEQYTMPTVSMPMAMPSWIDAQSPDLAATLDIMPSCGDAGLAISLEDQAMAHAVGFATGLEMDPAAPERLFHRRVSSTSSLTDDSVEDMIQQSYGQLKPSAAQHSAPTLATRRRKRVPKPLNVAGGRVVKCGLPSGQQSPALTLGLNNWSLGHPDDLPTPLTPLSAATYQSAAASSSGLTSALAAYFPWTSPPMTPLNMENQAFSVPLQQTHQQHAPPPTPQSQQPEPQQQEQQQHFYASCAPPQSAPATQLAFPPSVMPDLPAPPQIMDPRHLRRPSLPNAPVQPSVDRGLWLEFSSPMPAMNMDIPNGFTY